MAVSINSRHSLSCLIRQTFQECAGARPAITRRTYQNTWRALHTKQHASTTTANTPPLLDSVSKDDQFIPFKSEPLTSNTTTIDVVDNVVEDHLSSSWPSRPSTSGYVCEIEITPPQKSNVHNASRPAKKDRKVQTTVSSQIDQSGASSASIESAKSSGEPPKNKEEWQTQKEGLRKKFRDEPWNPKKKLSPDALEGIRAMHAQYPDHFTTPVLADHFKISPEAVRRILKSKWKPNVEEEEDRIKRWERRGERVWSELVESKAMRPPKKWRDKGIGKGIPRAPSGQLDLHWRDGTTKASKPDK